MDFKQLLLLLLLLIHEHLQLHVSNTHRKHNIHHTPYTNLQHTSTLQGLQNTIFNNSSYTTNIPTNPHTVTTTDINTNMRHVNTSIVSRHLATRGNNKILCTPTPHISSSEEILPASLVAPLPNSEQINHPSSNHTYTKSTPKHIHYHYAPSVTLTYTIHITSSTAPTYAPHCYPWILDKPYRSDCTAGHVDGEAGWCTTRGNIVLPPLARGMGVGRQQQQQQLILKCMKKI